MNTSNQYKKIEIRNFGLTYDGIYSIRWEDKETQTLNRIKVYLPLNIILEMIKIEGLTYDEIKAIHYNWKYPIHFNKVVMYIEGIERDGELSFITSEVADKYQEYEIYLFDVNILGE